MALKKTAKTPAPKYVKALTSKTGLASRASKSSVKAPVSRKRSRDNNSVDNYEDGKPKSATRTRKKKVTMEVEEDEQGYEEDAEDGEEVAPGDEEGGNLVEEEDSQAEHHQSSSLIDASQMDNLYKAINAAQQKKHKKAANSLTDPGGLNTYFADIRDRMDAIQAGLKGITARQKVIQTFRSNLESKSQQSERFRKQSVVANQDRYAVMQNSGIDNAALEAKQVHWNALEAAIEHFPNIHIRNEAGLHKIATAQEEEARMVEEARKVDLDAKDLIRNARRYLRAATVKFSKRMATEQQ